MAIRPAPSYIVGMAEKRIKRLRDQIERAKLRAKLIGDIATGQVEGVAETISHNFELRRLQHQKKKTRKHHTKLYDEAQKQKKKRDELEEIIHDEWGEVDFIDDKIAKLQTRYLLQQAEKYLIPKPEFDTDSGAWEKSRIDSRFHLTPTAMSELKAAVRHERKERREHWQSWLVLIVGLVGALTGLFSVLNSN